jgi:hypothetical protein
MNDFINSSLLLFKYYKGLGEKAMSQLDDDQVNQCLDVESNSIAVIVKHLSGNMLSRFSDFLTTDGEKPNRNRDQEFEVESLSRQQLLDLWNNGWNCLFNALEQLNGNDLDKIIFIRNEGHSVMEAIQRQLAHYSYHIGQLVFIARTIKGDKWISLSIPKGGSAGFNKEKFNKEKVIKHFTSPDQIK